MIAVVDYGMGNLRSVAKALERVGGEVEVTARPGDPFAAFRPVKVVWAIEFKNGAFSLPRPQPIGQ